MEPAAQTTLMPSEHDPRVRTLHCLLPGLAWPVPGQTSLPPVPALAALLGRAHCRHEAAQPWSHWLATHCGRQGWGLLRRLGEEDGAVRPGRWLCADPVHLHMTRDALLLRGPDELDVDTQESLALVDTLNQEFSELGQFHVATPQRWYLQLRGPAQADFHPLVDVLGRPVSQFTPEGTDARRWNLHANAIQILLHNHPVNAARQARGALPINGLWLWGAGEPDTGLPAPPAILSEDPLLRGFARHHGAGIVADADSLLASGGWWHDSRLHQAMLATDPHAWLTALAELEDVLFRPLLTAWRAGRIDALYLHAPGDQHALTATLTRRARWALWRRPLSPARLSALLQGSA